MLKMCERLATTYDKSKIPVSGFSDTDIHKILDYFLDRGFKLKMRTREAYLGSDVEYIYIEGESLIAVWKTGDNIYTSNSMFKVFNIHKHRPHDIFVEPTKRKFHNMVFDVDSRDHAEVVINFLESNGYHMGHPLPEMNTNHVNCVVAYEDGSCTWNADIDDMSLLFKRYNVEWLNPDFYEPDEKITVDGQTYLKKDVERVLKQIKPVTP